MQRPENAPRTLAEYKAATIAMQDRLVEWCRKANAAYDRIDAAKLVAPEVAS